MSKKMKRVVTWVLVVCLGIIGFSLLGVKSVKASEETGSEKKVEWEYLNVAEYREGRTQKNFKAPEKDGYVFAGWYTQKEGTTSIEEDFKTGMAYAKFVPEEILSVKAQLIKELLEPNGEKNNGGAIRFVTTVDTLQYTKIGFYITINGTTAEKASSQVYDTLFAIGEKGGDPDIEYTPQAFCSLSQFFKTWAFTNIPADAYGTPIEVQAFWVTQDGTTVLGEKATKNIHDGIDDFNKTVTADTSWYDSPDPETGAYIINTRRDLYGFNTLCNSGNNYFQNKTIKVDADIALNAGNAEEWGDNPPENNWTPISFRGTFDGDGHTISGVYVKTTNQYTGLFETIYKGAKVMNLRIVNSYIEGNGSVARSGVGTIAGRMNGTVDTVYSDAILKNSKKATGGIAGMANGSDAVSITNCWFNGKIYTTDGGSGGILGIAYSSTVQMGHCLNTGELNITNISTGALSQIGGLCGCVESGSATLELKDSLNAGSIKTEGNVTKIGTIVGEPATGCTVKMNNVYGINDDTKGFSGLLVGSNEETQATKIKSEAIAENDIKDIEAYKQTTLDFVDYWVLREGEIPVLATFVDFAKGENITDLSEAKKAGNIKWYDADKKEFTISTPQELYGFNSLGDFTSGKTFTLDADITMNIGNAEDWEETPPDGIWVPYHFRGTFNGAGHTISGVYVNNSTETHTGLFNTMYKNSVVKNLKLVNSYIEGSRVITVDNKRAGVGSIAGQNHGTIDTVYSEAILKNINEMTGGIAGFVSAAGDNVFKNCWFNGRIIASYNSSGGILGGTYGSTTTIIEHCLNTGELHISGTVQRVGGLCSYIMNSSTLNLKDSLNAGKLYTEGNVTQIGTVIGGIQSSAGHLNVENVYGIKEFSADIIGWSDEAFLTGTEGAFEALPEENCYGQGAAGLSFGNGEEGHWWIARDGQIPMLASFQKLAETLGK